MKRFIISIMVGLAILFITGADGGVAHAQLTYDPANAAYFVTGDAVIDTDITGNDVFVGKNNATDFTTLPGSVALTVAPGATTTGAPPKLYPDGLTYSGVYVFGDHQIAVTGGSVQQVYGNDASIIHVSGGNVGAAATTGASVINVTGGNISSASGNVNISGGTAGYLTARAGNTINVSGGDVIQADATGGPLNSYGTLNISGGSVSQAYGSGVVSSGNIGVIVVALHGALSITGGNVALGDGSAGLLNISGGVVSNFHYNTEYLGQGVLNISGGSVGGIDPDITDSDYKGIVYLGKTLNVYGSGLALSEGVNGEYTPGFHGVFYTLTGTLLDGTPLNTTLFVDNHVTLNLKDGGTQDNPILPDSGGNGVFTFENVPSGAWVDPPLVGAYEFARTDGGFFTSILDFPSGVGDTDGLFTVLVGNVSLGQFVAGQSVNFADFGFAGGVPSFIISGISPPADAGNPMGFPVRLGYSTPFASFTMTGMGSAAAPEPATLALFLPFIGISTLLRTRRRRLFQRFR